MAKRDIELIGDKKLIKKLKALSAATAKKVVRPAIEKAVKVVAKEAKRLAPEQTKLLKKSIGQRVKTYKHSGAIVGIIGPRTGFKKEVIVDGKGEVRNPTKYAHLVELGTSKRAAQPFLRPALENKRSAALAILRSDIAKNIDKQIKAGAR